ncbi:MAG: hypothetical protein AAF411_03730 [Myxococcota bacterium]
MFMKGDVIFRVYGVHAGRAKDVFFGAFRTESEAQAKIEVLHQREMHGQNWAARCHDQGFDIRPVEVETEFVIPSSLKPRDEFWVEVIELDDDSSWGALRVDVYRRGHESGETVATYERNYGLLSTFEPFRQGDRNFALISRNYTATAVLDLDSGKVVAEEPVDVHGFCPVGFYVPDWWDVHDGSIIPGSAYWDEDTEWPVGDFGFVWGCVWGDDSSWKVQHLDLSRVSEGIIRRDSRYGYAELACSQRDEPWRQKEAPAEPSKPPSFIDVSRYEGRQRVTFALETRFDIEHGVKTEP